MTERYGELVHERILGEYICAQADTGRAANQGTISSSEGGLLHSIMWNSKERRRTEHLNLMGRYKDGHDAARSASMTRNVGCVMLSRSTKT